ncbi:MAG: response regulator [Rhodopirellula sp. JB055]|uniref:response regulator n=1 Tax=Rhodopirellula sp. JB055 TaxID=3342846 RepID=UPI00370A83A9
MSSLNDVAREAIVLMAEDNPAECRLAERALCQGVLRCNLQIVPDGEVALDYLHRRGKFADPTLSPTPDLVLLDLNMPKIDGRQELADIKRDPILKQIPIVILTTSKAEQDVIQSYALGCNSFLSKPVDVTGFIEVLKSLGDYWFKLVVLPPKR